MSGRRVKRLRAVATLAQGPVKSHRAKKALFFAVPIVLIAAIATGYIAFFHDKPTKTAVAGTTALVKVVRSAKTLDDLLKIPADKLGSVDVAEMNLLCAAGLPGAEKLDIDHALATLDQWASRVASETDRHIYRVNDPRYADHYRHSEAYLRVEMLLQVLQQDLGVKYDMAVKDNFAFNDSRVAFIHGMIPAPGQTIADTPGGTCASMPVMYVAVGRRLGYPLKLVTTKGHIFVRWEGKDNANPAWRERFNIEGSGEGFSSFEDDYYKTWPFKLTDQEVQTSGYLTSLTASEEFAEFMAARGHCGLDNGQMAFAARCYENAYRYDTRRPAYSAWFTDAAMRSGYRPHTPALASLLARSAQIAASRRPAVNTGMQMPSEIAAAMTDLPGVAPTRIGQWQQPQSIATGISQPPSPYGPRPSQVGVPQPGMPQSGVPNPYQPYQPPVPEQPPR